MGTVWLCRDDVLGREVALKQVGTLPGEATPDLARALREARSSAALNHRNVVAIYDAIEEGDEIWLVMEYVPSRTLAEIVAQDGALPPSRVVWIGAQVADGLAAAHARRTIHRDVKPGNILVTDDDLAKISDFGIARTHGDAQLTQVGLVIGTPAYFSPELARGAEPSPAADVWALGATLYAAVEGRPLYPEQANPIATLTAIASGAPPRAASAGFLAEPISRMLDPDPTSRWSMADVAHVLHRLRDQHASDDTRAQTAAFTAGSAASAPVSRPAVEEPPATTQVTPAHRPTGDGVSSASVPSPPAADQPRGRGGRALVAGLVALLALVAVAGFMLLNDRDENPTASDPSGARDTSSSSPASPEQSPEQSPEPSPEESAQSPSTESPTPEPSDEAAPVGSTEGEQFVTSYYGELPEDTRSGWAKLSPEFQSGVGSYGNYRGFWSGFSAVDVTGVTSPEDGVVDVSLTYTHADGRTEDEVRRIYLEAANGGYLVVDDEIIN
jgi:serine/threonine protein kinase